MASSGSNRPNGGGGVTSSTQLSPKRSTESNGADKNNINKTKPSNSRQVACYFCKQKGHIKPNCPKWKQSSSQPVSLVMSVPTEERSVQREEAQGVVCTAVEQPRERVLPEQTTGTLGGSSQGITEGVPDGPQQWGRAFLHDGEIELDGQVFPVRVFRDSGARQSLCVRLPGMPTRGDNFVLVRGVNSDVCYPVFKMSLRCPVVSAQGPVALVESLPLEGVQFLLGADLAGDRVFPPPVCISSSVLSQDTDDHDLNVYPVCAVTRSLAKIADADVVWREEVQEDDVSDRVEEGVDGQVSALPVRPNHCERDQSEGTAGEENEVNPLVVSGPRGGEKSNKGNPKGDSANVSPPHFSEVNLAGGLAEVAPAELRRCQQADAELVPLFNQVDKVSVQPGGKGEFFIKKGLLFRSEEHGRTGADDLTEQLVVPQVFRQELLHLAHAAPLAGHLGVRKTLDRLLHYFWWPKMHASVADYLQSCHVCQLVGKPNQKVPVAPLQPIPVVGIPFHRVIIDMVGPLPRTSSGNQYLLTILDVATRYPEAIPVPSIHSKVISRRLLDFFTRFGLPKQIQSDRGTNFTSNLFKQLLQDLGVEQLLSSAYHPQSQGALERAHQTIKAALRKFCLEHERDWDQAIPLVLFAFREVPSEALGFSPNELVFGHQVRGPLAVVRDVWEGEVEVPKIGLLDYVMKTRERLHGALRFAQENLGHAQRKMKAQYDQKAKPRSSPGNEVLVLLPHPGNPLAAKFNGPYKILKRVGELDYLVDTPDRKKPHQLCHVNMLKPYYRPTPVSSAPTGNTVNDTTAYNSPASGADVSEVAAQSPVMALALTQPRENEGEEEDQGKFPGAVSAGAWSDNTLSALWEKLAHLEESQRQTLYGRLVEYPAVFRDTPGLTTWAVHDIDVGDNKPVKQAPYRASPTRVQALQDELDYMLEKDLIERGWSEWASPVTLQPKPGGKMRFCIDFRKVNALSRTDTYPLPRVDDSIDAIGASKYITKVDLAKGYWQVPLTPRAQQIASFVVAGGVYQCKVMPFGLKNAPSTFQRLNDRVVDGVPNCSVYIDDVIVYDVSWEAHMDHVTTLFRRLNEAGLVVNLMKCEFVKVQVQYLGYVVGQNEVAPPGAKVEAIKVFAQPKTKRGVQRFLGMIGYYRRFIKNYSTVLAPLTDLLKKDARFVWTGDCDQAFRDVKALLCNYPILRAPDFSRPFKLAVDASNTGAGAVLLQDSAEGIEHPISFFSKKFNKAQTNYSVVEKELLSLILALEHFNVYLPPFGPEIVIYSDHHPLQFLSRFRNKNQRLTRWSLMLQEYALIIRHIKGVDNVMADCLSRVNDTD